ncbi:MAG: Alcohol dehydrogenase, partial [uncultured Friedmanniella sp.]
CGHRRSAAPSGSSRSRSRPPTPGSCPRGTCCWPPAPVRSAAATCPTSAAGCGRTRPPRTAGAPRGPRASRCTRSSARSSPAGTPTTPPVTSSSAGRRCSTASPNWWSLTATAWPATTPVCRPPPPSCSSPWPACSTPSSSSATSRG